VAESAFREVTRDEFESIYFRLGSGATSGWTADYWKQNFGDSAPSGWKFLVEDPRSAAHDQMWIVADHGAREHRLFFTDESTDDVMKARDAE
jgi:hypothetical protein